uniref:Prefoldin subunit n=1 Tax=Panagrellus redivivus TaxID=6233 RepID=A0A7E4VRQ6_PANRE
MSTPESAEKDNVKNQQKIVNGFKELREHQQHLLSELRNTEAELRELHAVLKLMQTVDAERTTLTRVGSIMTTSKVGDDIKAKVAQFNKQAALRKELEEKLIKKSEEINEYQKTNNIRVLTEEEVKALENQRLREQVGAAGPRPAVAAQ